MAWFIPSTPWRLEEASSKGSPRIVDCDGQPICSFGNESRWRGMTWAWEVARAIVEIINEEAERRKKVKIIS